MSDESANLSLPYLQPSQAQKHVTHNEALLRLDALVQLSVISATTASAPGAPEEGDRYIVPSVGSGTWSGHDGDIAMWSGEAWVFLSPRAGWAAWVGDTGQQYRHDGADWQVDLPELQNLPQVGVNATADVTNRLTVSSPATLLTHSGAGHQLKLNKAGASDTASLLFQSGWSGRAEMGIIGDDAFAIKVSADGAAFQTSLTADPATGQIHFPNGATGLAPANFADSAIATAAYVASRDGGLFANSLGSLRSDYNYPAAFTRDPAVGPGTHAAFSYAGYASGRHDMAEVIPVDPNACYQVSCLIRQEGMSGDFSGFAQEDRQTQSFGAVCIDADGHEIAAHHNVRFKSGGIDSLTTLAAPLTPGDTEIHLVDASGWNDTDTDAGNLGIAILAYRDSAGRTYTDYTRHADTGMFLTTGVNKVSHVVTLQSGFPTSMGNPDDGAGTWPAGTPVANTAVGRAFKLIAEQHVLDTADTWYRIIGYLGGQDRSGEDQSLNFAPGCIGIRLAWIPNQSLVPGGAGGFPDTGAGQRVWIAAANVRRTELGVIDRLTSGGCSVYVPQPSVGTGDIQLITAATQVIPLP
ncbi:DUF2793 domain-containing protein [Pseudooceanicola sp. MF1-13]|uniref:DUF2793 domain-containing protein n=1 Tax=Pseudooceanicola sp. MF1-13 TaxID=3379095 RepID=UPI003891632D